MAKLTLIVGTGGSGKSSLARQLAKERNEPYFEDATLVDMHNVKQRAGYGKLTEIVARLLGQQQNCIIDESFLTNHQFRDHFIAFCDDYLPGVQREWIFFENDPLRCINNVYFDAYQTKPENRRNEPSRFVAVLGQIKEYSVPDIMTFPEMMLDPVPVYSCENPKFHDKDQAIEWLRCYRPN